LSYIVYQVQVSMAYMSAMYVTKSKIIRSFGRSLELVGVRRVFVLQYALAALWIAHTWHRVHCVTLR